MRGQCSVYPFRFSYCSALLLSSQSRSTRALTLLFIVVKSYGGRIAISIGVRSGIYEGQGDVSAEPISISTEKIERLSSNHDEFCRTQRYWTAVVSSSFVCYLVFYGEKNDRVFVCHQVPPNGYTAGRFQWVVSSCPLHYVQALSHVPRHYSAPILVRPFFSLTFLILAQRLPFS